MPTEKKEKVLPWHLFFVFVSQNVWGCKCDVLDWQARSALRIVERSCSTAPGRERSQTDAPCCLPTHQQMVGSVSAVRVEIHLFIESC